MFNPCCQPSRFVLRNAGTLFRAASAARAIPSLDPLLRCGTSQRNYAQESTFLSAARAFATESRAILDAAKEDNDVFGTLSAGRRRGDGNRPEVGGVPGRPPNPADNFIKTAEAELEGDPDEEAFESKPGRNWETRLPISHYMTQIKSFLKKNMLKEALDVLEVKMLKRDGRRPDLSVYNLLIMACGTRGYTEKAFQLFNDLKARGLKPGASIYTALFNACAYSPWKEDGLKRAHHLYDLMVASGFRLNPVQYDCAVKAFGRCGDFETALKLVDAAVKEGHTLSASAFNALLHGCVEDKTNGFRDALLVWRKMRLKGVAPTVQTYNLLLRAVRDCGAGDSPNAGQELLESLTTRETALPKRFLRDAARAEDLRSRCILPAGAPRPPPLRLAPSKDEDAYGSDEGGGDGGPATHSAYDRDGASSELERHAEALMQATSLAGANAAVPLDLVGKALVTRQSLHDIVGVNRLDKSEDRLMLLGGAPRILLHMRADGLTPDIKTFSQLLSSLPRNDRNEKFLLDLLKIHGVKPDTDFFNQLIKRQCLRGFWHGARDSLKIMSAEPGCHPDIVTFGVLALGCSTSERQAELLADLDDMGFKLNVEVAGAFLREAVRHVDYPRAVGLMRLMKERGVDPSPQTIHLFECLRKKALVDRMIGERHVRADPKDGLKNSDIPEHELKRKEKAIVFLGAYKDWIKHNKIDLPQHPWKHFKEGNPPKTETI